MLPVLRDEPFDSPDHIFEVKWGGVRVIATIDGENLQIHGRNLRDLTKLYPELQGLPGSLNASRAVMDGEIVAWGAENLPTFDILRPRMLNPDAAVAAKRRSQVMFQVFDLLEVDGTCLLERPLYERRNDLHERLRPSRFTVAADFIRDDGIAFFEAVVRHGLEGVIAKDTNSPYLPGRRSDAWQEIRATQSDDFVIGGYTFGGGRRRDLVASLLVGMYRGRYLEFVGEANIGCSDREMKQLLALLTPLHGSDCPFVNPPEVPRFYYWCAPQLACHLRYSQWGSDGMLRFPLFVAPRPDIPPEECVRP
jgi:DNA ligase-1